MRKREAGDDLWHKRRWQRRHCSPAWRSAFQSLSSSRGCTYDVFCTEGGEGWSKSGRLYGFDTFRQWGSRSKTLKFCTLQTSFVPDPFLPRVRPRQEVNTSRSVFFPRECDSLSQAGKEGVSIRLERRRPQVASPACPPRTSGGSAALLSDHIHIQRFNCRRRRYLRLTASRWLVHKRHTS